MVYVNHCSLCFAKQLPSEVGLYQDDFSDEKSVLTALTSSFALLAFSKYRRARIALFHAYTASVASIIGFNSHSLRRLSVSTGELRLPLL